MVRQLEEETGEKVQYIVLPTFGCELALTTARAIKLPLPAVWSSTAVQAGAWGTLCRVQCAAGAAAECCADRLPPVCLPLPGHPSMHACR